MDEVAFLRTERRFDAPALAARRHTVAVRRPGFRCYGLETRGLVVDARACPQLAPRRSAERPPVGQLTVVLEGQFVLRRGAREVAIGAGEAALDALDPWDERWEAAPGGRFRALVVEWDRDHGAPVDHLEAGRLTPAELAAVAALTARLDADALIAGDLRALVARLRAAGVPLAALEIDPADRPPAAAVQLARALARCLGALDRAPDIHDLCAEAGVIERVLRRRWPLLATWMPLAGSWREQLAETRVLMAASLATARGATVERMAAALGYRGPSALLAAMRARGLGSPSQIRAL